MAHLPTPHPSVLPVTAERELEQRARVVAAAKSWLGTPYRQMGYKRGPRGAVDCSMLLVGAWVDAEIFLPFDPRPYPPEWHMHNDEERYLEWMDNIGTRTETPRPGDVVMWMVGKCFAHGGIIIENNRVIHAYSTHHQCSFTDLDDPKLTNVTRDLRRPRIFYDMWGRLREMKTDV